MTDLISPVHLHRVTGEGHGVGDLLHAVPRKREQHRERNARRRQIMQRVGNKPIKLGMRKPTHLVLQRNGEDHREDTHEQDREWRTEPSRPGEGRGSKDDQNKRRAFDVHRAERVGKSIQAFPNLRKAWGNHPGRGSFSPSKESLAIDGRSRTQTERIRFLRRWKRGHCSARWTPQEEDKDPELNQTHLAALWSRRTTGESPARQHGEGAEQGDFIGERQRARERRERPRHPRRK